jgi:hypothetical protein
LLFQNEGMLLDSLRGGTHYDSDSEPG